MPVSPIEYAPSVLTLAVAGFSTDEIEVLIEFEADDVPANPYDGRRDLLRGQLDLNLIANRGHVRNDRHQSTGG